MVVGGILRANRADGARPPKRRPFVAPTSALQLLLDGRWLDRGFSSRFNLVRPKSCAAATRLRESGLMPRAAKREPIPAGLEIHYEPRRPEFDPTLNIEVEVDRTGLPRNR